jgi:D-amino-acid dehydrogenase
MSKQITIIGGGVIGLCTAYFLQKEGFEISIIEKGDMTDGASFGNAGFISPSHFIPLASPAIIGKAFKWMLNTSSPFYIKPRLNKDLIRWGMAFWNSANKKTMQRNIPHLHNILQLSRELMDELKNELGNGFRMEEKGCLMLYKKASTGEHEYELTKEAATLGLETRIFSSTEIQAMEPDIEMDVFGGVLYSLDCHLHPGDFMQVLKKHLATHGVKFQLNTTVTGFEKKDKKIIAVHTSQGTFPCNEIIIAAGAWLPVLASLLDIDILLEAGKGYSMTYFAMEKNLHFPSILVERRVAMTPMGNDLRMGGTMEISGMNRKILDKRVAAIFNAAREYYPGLELPFPEKDRVWQGLRPLSPDGLPYIGRHSKYDNLIVSGGHAMMGVSLAAATGHLTEQLISGKKTSIGMEAFNPERFR